MNIMVTGHRPNGMPYRFGYDINNQAWTELKEVFKEIIKNNINTGGEKINLITGMALGVDQAFWQVADELRNKNRDINIEAAIPFKGQESMWPPISQRQYNNMINNSDIVTVVSPGGYSPEKLENRNRYMVDKSDIVIAVCNHPSSGTYRCIRYAESKNKKIYTINPDTLNYIEK